MADTTESLPDQQEQAQLRAKYYNATLVRRIDVHSDLARFCVQTDAPIPRFQAGQYVALGLGYWERRVQPSQNEQLAPAKQRKMVRRAYSISCPMIDDRGNLAACEDLDYLEFYVTLVRQADDGQGKPPALTPRLFHLREGDRLCVERRIVGRYTLEGVGPNDQVLMLGTGTGEAPHNAMAAQLLRSGHRGRIIVATTSRVRADLAYLQTHRELMQRYSHYRYLSLTTREPENIDSKHPGYVGKQYLQDLYVSGKLAEMAGTEIVPATTHVFLCGNPAMIGYTPPGAPPPRQPGMLQRLLADGFEHHDHHEAVPGVGHVRFEKYW